MKTARRIVITAVLALASAVVGATSAYAGWSWGVPR